MLKNSLIANLRKVISFKSSSLMLLLADRFRRYWKSHNWTYAIVSLQIDKCTDVSQKVQLIGLIKTVFNANWSTSFSFVMNNFYTSENSHPFWIYEVW